MTTQSFKGRGGWVRGLSETVRSRQRRNPSAVYHGFPVMTWQARSRTGRPDDDKPPEAISSRDLPEVNPTFKCRAAGIRETRLFQVQFEYTATVDRFCGRGSEKGERE